MVRQAPRREVVKHAAGLLELVISMLEALDDQRRLFLPIGRHNDFHIAIQTIIKSLAYWRQQL